MCHGRDKNQNVVFPGQEGGGVHTKGHVLKQDNDVGCDGMFWKEQRTDGSVREQQRTSSVVMECGSMRETVNSAVGVSSGHRNNKGVGGTFTWNR